MSGHIQKFPPWFMVGYYVRAWFNINLTIITTVVALHKIMPSKGGGRGLCASLPLRPRCRPLCAQCTSPPLSASNIYHTLSSFTWWLKVIIWKKRSQMWPWERSLHQSLFGTLSLFSFYFHHKIYYDDNKLMWNSLLSTGFGFLRVGDSYNHTTWIYLLDARYHAPIDPW